jgi:hypothetical protein
MVVMKAAVGCSVVYLHHGFTYHASRKACGVRRYIATIDLIPNLVITSLSQGSVYLAGASVRSSF